MEHKQKLSVSNLHFAYGKKERYILQNLNLEFAEGKITALLGANGCGKSTLIKLLSGVLKPVSGSICLGETDIWKMKRVDVAKQMAVVHQNNTAPSDYTVRKLVEAGRTPYHSFLGKKDYDADDTAVEQALKDTDTIQLSECLISELSGGQLQRVWLAMALAQQTDILLLDEITTYLDVHYQLELLHLIKQLNVKRKKTIVMVIHDINLAYQFCDEVVVMKQGEVLAKGDMDEALTESVLDEAFRVTTKMFVEEEHKYCIFHRKEEAHG